MSAMGVIRVVGVPLMLAVFVVVRGQGDSLRSALSAVDRRQRDLSEYPKYGDVYPYGYPPEAANHLAFLTLEDERQKERQSPRNDNNLLDFLEDNGYEGHRREQEGFKKRIYSPFRERVEEDKERQREELAKLFINSLDNERPYHDNDDYITLMQEVWDKYQNPGEPESYPKKSFYMPNGYGMRKRGRFAQPDSPSEALYILNYSPKEDLYNRLQERDEEDLDDYSERDKKSDDYQRFYPYAFRKRFPVSKRSSNYYPTPINNADFTHQQKRSPKKEDSIKTDPKVEKELSNIFGATPAKAENKHEKKTTPKPKLVKNATESAIKSNKSKNSKPANTKEVVSVPSNTEPLQIKKKSIDWSDYFGLDRRKKNDDLDNEWLMERYHKAMAMTTKRSTEYPLQHFHNHDQDKKEKIPEQFEDKVKKENPKSEEARIREMDEKLKTIEDSIVEDALKYTGAHEGAIDSKEIQEVKDRVISRLAAAYSLEKMRRALGEYKMSIAKERDRNKQTGQNDDYLFSEEKRVSVPRKQAIDEEAERTQEEDNNIKCAQGNQCEEQNFRIPSKMLDQYTWGIEQCPKVQNECNDMAITMGTYGRTLEQACNMLQLCLLCDSNSWFPQTIRCKTLYLSKTAELCDDNVECKRTALHSVEKLMAVNRVLRENILNECNIVCPENER